MEIPKFRSPMMKLMFPSFDPEGKTAGRFAEKPDQNTVYAVIAYQYDSDGEVLDRDVRVVTGDDEILDPQDARARHCTSFDELVVGDLYPQGLELHQETKRIEIQIHECSHFATAVLDEAEVKKWRRNHKRDTQELHEYWLDKPGLAEE